MIPREFAREQVRRLAGIPAPPPSTAEAIADLVDALESSARSESHAMRIISAIVESPGDPPRWPTIATIRAIAWELLTDEQKANHCRVCDGSGFLHRVKIVGGVSYDFSNPCPSCHPVEVAQ